MNEKNNESTPKEMKFGEKLNLDSDWFLRILIAQVNHIDLEIGITIYVNGLIISGLAISGKKYFEEIAEQYKSGFTGDWKELGESVGDTISNLSKDYPVWETAAEDGNSDNSSSELEPMDTENVGFIHLKNVQIQTQTGFINQHNALYRGRLESVDGFHLGTPS